MNLREEYPKADLTNIETLKQIVINKFKENGLPITKIRRGVGDGIFVYHPDGMRSIQNKRVIIHKTDNSITYQMKKEYAYSSFIATDDLQSFEDYLQTAIVESKNRRGVK